MNSEMISLQKAVLCVDCERISETPNDCAACGSKAVIPLLKVLGGSLKVDPVPVVSEYELGRVLHGFEMQLWQNSENKKGKQ
jgi:hypothetical protein